MSKVLNINANVDKAWDDTKELVATLAPACLKFVAILEQNIANGETTKMEAMSDLHLNATLRQNLPIAKMGKILDRAERGSTLYASHDHKVAFYIVDALCIMDTEEELGVILRGIDDGSLAIKEALHQLRALLAERQLSLLARVDEMIG